MCTSVSNNKIRFFNSIRDMEKFDNFPSNFKFPLTYYPQYLSLLEKMEGECCQQLFVSVEEKGSLKAIVLLQKAIFKGKEAISFLSNVKEKGITSCIKEMVSNLFIGKVEDMEMDLAVSGNLFFTGDNGFYFANNLNADEKHEIIIDVVEYLKTELKTNEKIKAIILMDFYENEMEFDFLVDKRFSIFPTEPDLFMDIDAEWLCFSDYLSAIASKYRVKYNKVIQLNQQLTIKDLSYDDILSQESKIWELYKNVAINASFNLGILPQNYFSVLKQNLEDKFIVEGYFIDNQLVGFTSMFIDYPVLEDHYIGLDYTKNSEFQIYHRMLYEYIRVAINNRLKLIHYGRTATEIKTSIGAYPKEMKAFLCHQSKFANYFIQPLTKNIVPKPYIIRNPFKEKSLKLKEQN